MSEEMSRRAATRLTRPHEHPWPTRAGAALAMAALLAIAPCVARAGAPATSEARSTTAGRMPVNPGPGHFVRVRVTIYGIFSPRGVFNLVVRLYKLKGLKRYKFDMPDALMTLDFEPGVAVEPAAIRAVMVNAGYQPGPFKIAQLPLSEAASSEPGWLKPPKVESKWALIRWLEQNF